MIVLSMPRRLRGPTRAESIRNPSNELVNRTFVAECLLEVFCQWMVPTDTHGRSGYLGGRCVALTWPGAVEDRPDWSSD